MSGGYERMKPIGRLHVLTDTVMQTRFSHSDLARLALRGGADTIQFRQKTGSTREMIRIAAQMKQLCSDYGVPLIVNDRVDVAIAAEADGVHLGQEDFPVPLARELLGEEKIIGASASDIIEGQKCLEEGADYIGFGPVYPTTSKDDAGAVKGVNTLTQIVEAVSAPIIAIGGISSNHVSEILQAGAHGIAVISSVCCQEDPEQATRALYQVIIDRLGP